MTSGNPWQAESLQDFSFLCCPECVFRTQAEIEFQSHALITHPESRRFFNKLEGKSVSMSSKVVPIFKKLSKHAHLFIHAVGVTSKVPCQI